MKLKKMNLISRVMVEIKIFTCVVGEMVLTYDIIYSFEYFCVKIDLMVCVWQSHLV